MFVLNSTLEKDSSPLMETDLCLIRMINDARYPWVLVVPKIPDVSELHDLTDEDYAEVMALARKLGKVLKVGFDADKINTAAIGNMVPQLHVHIVARHRDDAAWPAPVWGVGDMEPLSGHECSLRSKIIKDAMSALA